MTVFIRWLPVYDSASNGKDSSSKPMRLSSARFRSFRSFTLTGALSFPPAALITSSLRHHSISKFHSFVYLFMKSWISSNVSNSSIVITLGSLIPSSWQTWRMIHKVKVLSFPPVQVIARSSTLNFLNVSRITFFDFSTSSAHSFSLSVIFHSPFLSVH